MGDFRMPSLGADMDAGTIVEWRIAPGDVVHRGDIVAVVDTAKAAIEIEAFEDGIVEQIVVGTGVQVPVGTTLARFGPPTGAPGEEPPGAQGAGGVPAPAAAPASPAEQEPLPGLVPAVPPPVRRLARQLGVDLATVVGTGHDGHITHEDVVRAADGTAGAAADSTAPSPGSGAARSRATPRARRLAAQEGADLARIAGSGPGGAVLGEDVEAALAAPSGAPLNASPLAPPGASAPAPASPAPDRKAAMRSAIASLMSRSAAEIPHYYVTQTLDLAPALAWLRVHNADLPAQKRVLRAALFLRATVVGALAVPDLNGHWTDGQLHRAGHVDLGVAVATRGGGLVTPAIPHAEGLGIDDLMAALADLVRRARGGALRQAEMAGATITVSSLGETGPDALYGVIFPPQVALVGLGGIVERAWAVKGMLTVRPTVTVTLAADHRASDGRTASAFLSAFAHALEHPEDL